MGKVEVAAASSMPPRTKPGHDRLKPTSWTGKLMLRMSTLPDEGLGVVPGSGAMVIYNVEGQEQTVEACSRRHGMPIIPGTSVKGSIRTLYELLTGSCNINDFRSRCRGGRGNDRVCAACALFGHLGYAGRLGFDDAVPESGGSVDMMVVDVPVAWTPRSSRASYRLYDGKPALGADGEAPRDFIQVELFAGAFLGRMRFRNAEPVEMGRLFLALGLGEGALSFTPKLGGKKFDGQGAVKVEVAGVTLSQCGKLGCATEMEGDEALKWVAEQISTAKSDRSWDWPQVERGLTKLARRLQEGY